MEDLDWPFTALLLFIESAPADLLANTTGLLAQVIHDREDLAEQRQEIIDKFAEIVNNGVKV